MSDALPVIYLARHGETAWTIACRHTGVTDLPLTAQGEAEAIRLGERFAGSTFAAVLTSPLQRAVRGVRARFLRLRSRTRADLLEWNYGTYEGRTLRADRRHELAPISRPGRLGQDRCVLLIGREGDVANRIALVAARPGW